MTSYPLAPSPTPPPDPGDLETGTSTPNPTPTPAPASETAETGTSTPVPPNEGNNNTPSESGQLTVAGGEVFATSSGGVGTSSGADDGGFHFTDTGTTQDAFAQSLYSLYTGLWGSPPSSKWLAKAIESGDNIWEIENRERTKPAWQHTQAYRDELSQYAFQVAKSLGLM